MYVNPPAPPRPARPTEHKAWLLRLNPESVLILWDTLNVGCARDDIIHCQSWFANCQRSHITD